MLYLSRFEFPSQDREAGFMMEIKRTCYDSAYPFGTIVRFDPTVLEFEPVTILYGGNGCGKTTALNVIAGALMLQRDSRYNQSPFFGDYVKMCRYETRAAVPLHSRVITSDDVFDYMLNIRALNEGVDNRREELFEEYFQDKYAEYRVRSLDDYEALKRRNMAQRKTQSKYVRARLATNVREQSNGESAYFYFTSKIEENGLYLLDEPENSLSPARQQELLQFLEDSARFFGCQFIIATHSPFLLSMRGAKIYDMEADPICSRRWTELEAVRAYHDFFKRHAAAFEED